MTTPASDRIENRLLRRYETTAPKGWAYANPTELVVYHGQAFSPHKVIASGPQVGPLGYCFATTQWLVMSDARLAYVEGYATTDQGQDVLHAWAVDRHGRVYDATWPVVSTEYFGICFRTEYLLEMFTAAPASIVNGMIARNGYQLVRNPGPESSAWTMSPDDLVGRRKGDNLKALAAALTRPRRKRATAVIRKDPRYKTWDYDRLNWMNGVGYTTGKYIEQARFGSNP